MFRPPPPDNPVFPEPRDESLGEDVSGEVTLVETEPAEEPKKKRARKKKVKRAGKSKVKVSLLKRMNIPLAERIGDRSSK